MPSPPDLVVITDRHAAAGRGRTVPEVVAAALTAGAPAVLLRDRELEPSARRTLGHHLRELVDDVGALLLVGGAALAQELGAHGVHLAAGEPVPPDLDAGARRPLVGRSCHDTREVTAARAAQLDYATVSPVAPTASKPGYGPPLGTAGLRRLVDVADGLPILALGGVTPANVGSCRAAGAHGVAVMGGVMGADDPARAVEDLRSAWRRAPAGPPRRTRAGRPTGTPRPGAPADTSTDQR